MEKVIEELTNPIWWITVVVAGIIVNIIAAYGKTKLDRTISKTSSWWTNKSKERKQIEVQKLEELKSSKVARYKAHFYSTRNPILATFTLLIGISTMLIVSIVEQYITSNIIQIFGLAIGSITFFAAYVMMISSFNLRIRLFKAIEELPEDESP